MAILNDAKEMKPYKIMLSRRSALFTLIGIEISFVACYSMNYVVAQRANIQRRLYGRLFYLDDEDEMGKLEAAGGHTDPKKCLGVVDNAAK